MSWAGNWIWPPETRHQNEGQTADFRPWAPVPCGAVRLPEPPGWPAHSRACWLPNSLWNLEQGRPALCGWWHSHSLAQLPAKPRNAPHPFSGTEANALWDLAETVCRALYFHFVESEVAEDTGKGLNE